MSNKIKGLAVVYPNVAGIQRLESYFANVAEETNLSALLEFGFKDIWMPFHRSRKSTYMEVFSFAHARAKLAILYVSGRDLDIGEGHKVEKLLHRAFEEFQSRNSEVVSYLRGNGFVFSCNISKTLDHSKLVIY